jgi:hypothetical protein
MHAVARCGAAIALLSLALRTPGAQVPGGTETERQKAAAVPWTANEFLEYKVKVGFVTAGSGRMAVVGKDTLRGHTAWHLHFNVTGGFLIRVDDSYHSWMDVETLSSLRFVQDLYEAGRKPTRYYEIFPERTSFSLNGAEEKPSVAGPLDDASFFYFIRTVPLKVGETYEFARYFDPKANPVIIQVLRKDTITVDAGTFETIVIRPIIKTSGLFSQGGQAELWLSDDNRRILIQMKAHLPVVGSLNLYLRSMRNTVEKTPPPPDRPQ